MHEMNILYNIVVVIRSEVNYVGGMWDPAWNESGVKWTENQGFLTVLPLF